MINVPLLRIVKLTIKPELVPTFIEIYEAGKLKLEKVKGCYSVELRRDSVLNNVYYTVSGWESQAVLQAYRDSEVFLGIWRQLKPTFAERADAFSLESMDINMPKL